MNNNLNKPVNSSLVSEELADLMNRASEKRDARWGSIVTYSRKVFVPLTNMSVPYTNLRAHETKAILVCRLLLEQKKKDISATITEDQYNETGNCGENTLQK